MVRERRKDGRSSGEGLLFMYAELGVSVLSFTTITS